MINQEELADMNTKLPQAIQYIVESCTKLLLEVDTLTYERDEYQKKYHRSEELRDLARLPKELKE